MKISHHTYLDGKGFWIKESYFEIVSHFITEAFKQYGLIDQPSWFIDIYEDFNDIAKGYKQSYAYFHFKDNLKFIKDREDVLLDVLGLAIHQVNEEGEVVTKDRLNSIEEENKDWGEDTRVLWIKDIKVSFITNVIDILIRMLKHEWNQDIDIVWE